MFERAFCLEACEYTKVIFRTSHQNTNARASIKNQMSFLSTRNYTTPFTIPFHSVTPSHPNTHRSNASRYLYQIHNQAKLIYPVQRFSIPYHTLTQSKKRRVAMPIPIDSFRAILVFKTIQPDLTVLTPSTHPTITQPNACDRSSMASESPLAFPSSSIPYFHHAVLGA